MRKLNRPMPAPPALANYNHNVHAWSNNRPSQACRTLIWQNFKVMQGDFCAFCERATVKSSGHIEHFFHKGKKPDGTAPYRHLTFSWDNLFGCCGRFESNTCGHFKDREGSKGPGSYDPNDLIKPDVDDPALFFNFLDTGVIEAKGGLSQRDKIRASETIRVLNLGALNGVRKTQIDIFKNELKELEQMSTELDAQKLADELNKIKNKVRQKEFQTAVLGALF